MKEVEEEERDAWLRDGDDGMVMEREIKLLIKFMMHDVEEMCYAD